MRKRARCFNLYTKHLEDDTNDDDGDANTDDSYTNEEEIWRHWYLRCGFYDMTIWPLGFDHWNFLFLMIMYNVTFLH